MSHQNNNGILLSKKPCNNDLFEGKAHEKLSFTIAETIRNNQNCSIIGIDGGWGAGKSNLVGMISKELTNNSNKKKYHFFTYDAWGHQSDFQRRTILEELTYDLVKGDSAVLDEDKWKKNLDNLLAKKKETTTKTIPAIGLGTITSLFAILITPFITNIASLIACSWLKPLILILPYIAAYTWVLIKHHKNMKEKYEQRITTEQWISEFFLIYKNAIKEDTKYETISEKEPSSRQFKEWIHKIDKELKTKEDTTLIIVFDNMDRLPKIKVQELWSAIHSFFSEESYNNIKIIVPFDRYHIRNAFQSENIVGNSCSPREETISIYGDDFINKTFDVVYVVPPPILSEWMHFFKARWRDAFGENAEVDNSVLQIYDMLTEEHSPRKIIVFINQFITIRKLCDPEIEDRYIALYIFGKNTISANPLKEILSPSYLKGLDFLYKEDERMQECISALYYQLPITKSMDVVFTRKVTQEMNENKCNILKKLKDSSHLWEILTHSLTQITNIRNTALVLEKIFSGMESVKTKEVWNTIYQKCTKDTSGINDKYQDFHAIILSHISQKLDFFTYLINSFHSNIGEDFDLFNYVNGIDVLVDQIGDSAQKILDKKETEVSEDVFMKLVIYKKYNYQEYGLKVNEKNFDNYTLSLSADKIAESQIYPYIKNQIQIPKYCNRVKSLFKENYTNKSLETNLLKRLKEIEYENRPLNITEYLTDNQIYNFCNNIEKTDEIFPDALAIAIVRYSYYSPLQSFFNSNTRDFTAEQVTKTADCIEYYTSYNNLLFLNDNLPNNPFVIAITKNLTENSRGRSRLNLKGALTHFEQIQKRTKIDPNVLLNRWNDWKEYVSEITVDDIPHMHISLLSAMTHCTNTITEHCLNLAKKYISSISQENWKAHIINNDFEFQLINVIQPRNITLFADAFKELMRDYAMGVSNQKIPAENVNICITILKNTSQKIELIFSDIRDLYINSSNITRDKLLYFGPWLFEYGRLHFKKLSLQKIIRSEFLDDNDIILLLKSNQLICKKMIEKAENPKEFIDKIKALRETKYAEDNDFLDFCEYLNI